MRISLLLLAFFVGFAVADHDTFQRWMIDYGKKYSTKEETALRYSIFKDHLKLVKEHNAGKHSFTLETNKFADLAFEEFIAIYGMNVEQREPIPRTAANTPPAGLKRSNTGIDWEALGGVTDVPDQQTCNSCYAFAATGALETAWWLYNGTLPVLSAQQLVDCTNDPFYGNYGCNGGWPDYAYFFVMDEEGICYEEDYPYINAEGTCDTTCEKVVHMEYFHPIASFYQSDVELNMDYGTVATTFHVNVYVQLYGGGYFDHPSCYGSLNHVVLMTAYGTDANDRDFYRIRNSWGPSWGDDGYMTLAKGGSFSYYGQCMVHFMPYRPYIVDPW